MKELSKHKILIELILAFVFSFIIIITCFHSTTNFENMALGIYTRAHFSETNNVPIQTMGLRDNDKIIAGCKTRNLKDIVLIIGNSQTHSINQYKKGDETFTKILADSLNKKSIDVISSSVPNATMEDFYLLYKYWKENQNPKVVLLPIFLDDTREDGIQDVFYKNVSSYRMKEENPITKKINDQLNKLGQTESSDLAALHQTFQEKTENKLDVFLDKHFSPWHYRPEIRGSFFNNLYKLRNTVFGIDAKTKRGIIKNVYDENMTAFHYILEDAQRSNIKIIVYIPPLRNDYEIPYYKDEYINFKKQVEAISKNYDAEYLNLENAVPNKYWGTKGTRTFKGLVDIDFMHFQYPGHIIMANTLQPEIEKLLNIDNQLNGIEK